MSPSTYRIDLILKQNKKPDRVWVSSVYLDATTDPQALSIFSFIKFDIQDKGESSYFHFELIKEVNIYEPPQILARTEFYPIDLVIQANEILLKRTLEK